MKRLSVLLLIIFMAFLSMPTIISIVKAKSNTSVFYSLSEEEIHKEIELIKPITKCSYEFPVLTESEHESLQPLSGVLIQEQTTNEIFLPPPELV